MNKEIIEKTGNLNLKKGKKLLNFGFAALLILAFILNFNTNDNPSNEVKILLFCIFIFSLVSLLSGRYFNYKGRQLLAKLKTDDIFKDESNKVLYLRSFAKDSNMKNYLSRVLDGDLTGVLSNIYTEEEQLADALKPIGNLMAIGKPGEELPTPGAARVYVSNSEWQNVAMREMSIAKLVIIKIGGDGEGLNWEIDYANKNVNHKKLLFYLDMKNGLYKSYRQAVGDKLNFWFPENPNPLKSMNGFFRYRENGNLEFLPIKSNFLRTSEFSGKAKLIPFYYALKPVFDEFKVPWQKPPISKVSIAIIIIGILFLLNWLRS